MTAPIVKNVSGMATSSTLPQVLPNIPTSSNLNMVMPGIMKSQRGYQVQGVVAKPPPVIKILNGSMKRL